MDYFGIFVAFGRLQVIYLLWLRNTKSQKQFSTWPLDYLCCWYHRAWYSAWYYGQFIWVSLTLYLWASVLKCSYFESHWKLNIKNYDLHDHFEDLTWKYKRYVSSQIMVSDFCKTKIFFRDVFNSVLHDEAAFKCWW